MPNKKLQVWVRGANRECLEEFENEQGVSFYTNMEGLTVEYTFDEGNEEAAFIPMSSLVFVRYIDVEDNS